MKKPKVPLFSEQPPPVKKPYQIDTHDSAFSVSLGRFNVSVLELDDALELEAPPFGTTAAGGCFAVRGGGGRGGFRGSEAAAAFEAFRAT